MHQAEVAQAQHIRAGLSVNYVSAALQEHIRCSLELSCLAQCLDLQQRLAMAQQAISQLTGPTDFSAQAPSPAPRSPKTGPGKSTLKLVCTPYSITCKISWQT